MNNEPIKFLPVKHPWDAPVGFKFQVSSFVIGVATGTVGVVVVACAITYLLAAICQ